MNPIGKGMFIWQIKRILSGRPDLIAQEATELKLSWVVLKFLSGKWPYNLSQDSQTKEWRDDLIPGLVEALHRAGIKVYGYQYVYLIEPVNEAYAVSRRIDDLFIDGFVIDAESECYNKRQEAAIYAQIVKDKVRVPIGLCSYRFPSVHTMFPFKEFLSCCTFHLPQVYWVQATNPGDQLKRSYEELMEIKKLPFIPTGSAYNEHGWRPSIAEIDEFNRVAKDELQLPGICWWEWYEAIENGFIETIRWHDWNSDSGYYPASSDKNMTAK